MAKTKPVANYLPRSEKDDSYDNLIRCPMCGKIKKITEFYKSSSPLYANNQEKMVFCKECVLETYNTYYGILKEIKNSILITCMKFDIPFSESDYTGAIKQHVNNPTTNPIQLYMQKLNSLGSLNGGLSGFEPKHLFNEKSNKDLITDSFETEARDLEYNIELNEQDIGIKGDVIRLIGYDPFMGYSNFDQKFLYNELISYLDEDTLDDAFKLSQILQLVNNNNQVRKIDLVIANLSSDATSLVSNQDQIKSLTATKKSIVDNTDKIAKENSISVKNRGDKTAGKSTLTYLMKNYRELGFEDADQDYYDQKKSYGMKLVADISHQSLVEQLQFDENDVNDMFFIQRQLVTDLQGKVLDLEEENRQLYVKLGELSSSEV